MRNRITNGSLTIRGEDIPVELTDGLRLRANYMGEVLFADNAAELKLKLSAVSSRKKIVHNIPVVLKIKEYGKAPRLVRAILHAQHAKNRDWYSLTIDGKREQIDDPDIMAREMPDEQIAAANALYEAQYNAGLAVAAMEAKLGPPRGGFSRWSACTLLDEAAAATEPAPASV